MAQSPANGHAPERRADRGGCRRADGGARPPRRDRGRLVAGRDRALARARRRGRIAVRRRGDRRHDGAGLQRSALVARPFARGRLRRARDAIRDDFENFAAGAGQAMFAQPVARRAARGRRLGERRVRPQRSRRDGRGLGLAGRSGHARPDRRHPPADARRPWRPQPALWRRHRRPSRRHLARRARAALRGVGPRPPSRGAGAIQPRPRRVRRPPVARRPFPSQRHEQENHHVPHPSFLDQPEARRRARRADRLRQPRLRPGRPTRSSRAADLDTVADDQVVTVTARRTEENAAAGSGRGLRLQRARRSSASRRRTRPASQGAVPNLNIVQGRGSSNATNIFIRGIGQPDALQTFDPAVGVYVDGVYYSRIRGTQFDLLDLRAGRGAARPAGHALRQEHDRRRAELRHPPAGRRVPRRRHRRPTAPTTSSRLRGIVSGPLADGIAVGLAVLHAQRDGYVEDPVLDRDYNDRNTEAVRAAIAITPSDRVRIDLTADYSRGRRRPDRRPAAEQPRPILIGGGTALVAADQPDRLRFRPTRTTPSLPNSTQLDHWGVVGQCRVRPHRRPDAALDHRLSRARDRRLSSTSTRPSSRSATSSSASTRTSSARNSSSPTRASRLTAVARPLLSAREHHLAPGGLCRRSDRAAARQPDLPRTVDDDLVDHQLRRLCQPQLRDHAGAAALGRRALHPREQGLFPHDLDLLELAAADQPRAVRLRRRATTGTISRRWSSLDYQFDPNVDGLCPGRARLQVGRLQRPRQQRRRAHPVRAGDGDLLRGRLPLDDRRPAAAQRHRLLQRLSRLPGARRRAPASIRSPACRRRCCRCSTPAGSRSRAPSSKRPGRRCRACCSTPRSAISTPNMTSSTTSASRRRQPRLPDAGLRAGLDAALRRAI